MDGAAVSRSSKVVSALGVSTTGESSELQCNLGNTVAYVTLEISLSMRSIGTASRALELMLLRCTDEHKVAFGKQLYQHGTVVANIAQSRMDIDQARLLVLSAALQIDLVRAKGAMKDIGMAKAVVPRVVGQIIDRAMQVHGAEGICQDSPLPALWAGIRTLRYADGPDEVHIQQSESRVLYNTSRNSGRFCLGTVDIELTPFCPFSRSQGAQGSTSHSCSLDPAEGED